MQYDRIRTYFKENKGIVILLCITATCFDGLMWVLPILEGITINSLYLNQVRKIVTIVLLFLGFVLFVQINRFFKRFLVRVFANRIALRMRQISFDNLLKKDINYFIKESVGQILNKNLTDIYDTTEGIRKITTEVFDTFLLLIGYVGSMFFLDYQITLLVLIPIIISILLAQFLKKIIYKYNKDYKEYLSYNKDINLTLLNNELNYRGLGISANYDKLYEESTKILTKKNQKALMLQSNMEPIYQAIALMGLIFIILIGGNKVINETYLIGVLTAYLTTYMLVCKKASKVGKVFNAYQAFRVSFERAKEFLTTTKDEYCEPIFSYGGLDLINFQAYNPKYNSPILNIHIDDKKIIGICGKIHCGKSTILKALAGVLQYNGQALLKGVDIKDLATSSNSYVGFCTVDAKLFSDTLENNISLGRKGNIKNAIVASGIDHDLQEIGGLNACLSHTNKNVSGGQAKRIEMARCLYSKSYLVLLDDPFQSVNEALALEMVDNLKRLYNDRIIIFVSNNKKLLQKCNDIIYLDYDCYMFDTYENLILSQKFKDLMGDGNDI